MSQRRSVLLSEISPHHRPPNIRLRDHSDAVDDGKYIRFSRRVQLAMSVAQATVHIAAMNDLRETVVLCFCFSCPSSQLVRATFIAQPPLSLSLSLCVCVCMFCFVLCLLLCLSAYYDSFGGEAYMLLTRPDLEMRAGEQTLQCIIVHEDPTSNYVYPRSTVHT